MIHPVTGSIVEYPVILGAWCTTLDSREEPYWKRSDQINKWIARSPESEKMLKEWGKRNCSK